MGAGLVMSGLGEEFPCKDIVFFDLAVRTVLGDGSPVCDSCDEGHLEGLKIDIGVGNCEEELARKEGAG